MHKSDRVLIMKRKYRKRNGKLMYEMYLNGIRKKTTCDVSDNNVEDNCCHNNYKLLSKKLRITNTTVLLTVYIMLTVYKLFITCENYIVWKPVKTAVRVTV